MAATTAMQSVLGSSIAYGAAGNNRSLNLRCTVPASYAVSSYLRVRSMAEDGQKKQPTTVTKASKDPQPAASPPSPKFSDVFAFSGPAPERINGRLAMVGFVAALAVELSKGQDVFAQISDGPGVPLFIGTSILLSVASLVPLLKGVTRGVQIRRDHDLGCRALEWKVGHVGSCSFGLHRVRDWQYPSVDLSLIAHYVSQLAYMHTPSFGLLRVCRWNPN